jgi:acetolactate synthase-1/2/3 large subunit
MANIARSGGQLVVDSLIGHGINTAFGVPGESFLPVLDGFYERRGKIRFIICRHEAGAANMAEAVGKLTGAPGVCFVTRGPGATHASIGVHTAFQDSTPMILFVGQVGGDFAGREAFQEVDYAQMFGPLAKWAAQIDRAERVPEFISRAFHTATSGRPGPVVLALPEDMLTDTADVADVPHYQKVQANPSAGDVAKIRGLLEKAERPFLMIGGSCWDESAYGDVRRFAEANDLPVGCAFRYQDHFDNTHPNYAGDIGIGVSPKLAQRVKDADLLLVIGARLGEMTTSAYTMVESPVPKQKLVHVYPGAEELGRVHRGEWQVNSASGPMLAALAAMPPVQARWKAWTQAARADYEAWTARRENPGRVQMCDVIAALESRVKPDAIYCNGAGNYTAWVHRFHRHRLPHTQLAPTSGAMGYGVPAAVAAKILYPGREVIAFAGDGCFLMSGQELATAVQYKANVVFIVVNNGMYGTIRMHQEKHYPGRVSGTDLQNPDFAAYARAFGAHGELVEDTAQFAPALERCFTAGKPALIEIRLDPQAITPNTTLDAIRNRK